MRYAAFLRAINVGGHTVKMEPLRRVFESAGFDDVETIIASGNVVFESPRRGEAAQLRPHRPDRARVAESVQLRKRQAAERFVPEARQAFFGATLRALAAEIRRVLTGLRLTSYERGSLASPPG